MVTFLLGWMLGFCAWIYMVCGRGRQLSLIWRGVTSWDSVLTCLGRCSCLITPILLFLLKMSYFHCMTQIANEYNVRKDQAWWRKQTPIHHRKQTSSQSQIGKDIVEESHWFDSRSLHTLWNPTPFKPRIPVQRTPSNARSLYTIPPISHASAMKARNPSSNIDTMVNRMLLGFAKLIDTPWIKEEENQNKICDANSHMRIRAGVGKQAVISSLGV